MSGSHQQHYQQPSQSAMPALTSAPDTIVVNTTTAPSAAVAHIATASSPAPSSSNRRFLFGGGNSAGSRNANLSYNNFISLPPTSSYPSSSFSGVREDGELSPRSRRRRRKRQKTMEESFQQMTLHVESSSNCMDDGIEDHEEEDSSEEDEKDENGSNNNHSIVVGNKKAPNSVPCSTLPPPGARRWPSAGDTNNSDTAKIHGGNPVDERLEEMIRISRLRAYVADQQQQKTAQKGKNNNVSISYAKDTLSSPSSSMTLVRARDDFDVGWRHRHFQSQSQLLLLENGQKGEQKKRRCNGQRKKGSGPTAGKPDQDKAADAARRGRNMSRNADTNSSGTRSLSLPREYKQNSTDESMLMSSSSETKKINEEHGDVDMSF